MPNFMKAVDALSLSATAVGMLSNGSDIAPLFSGLGTQRYSYLDAGAATAFEFEDGKFFFSSANTPEPGPDERIFTRVENAFPGFSRAAAAADLTAFLNWSELPFAQNLWDDIFTHAFEYAETDKTRFVFFDLCDSSAKDLSQIEAVVSLIGKFASRRRTILSMNANEALDIGGKITGRKGSAAELAPLIFNRLCLDELLIHQHSESLAFSAAGIAAEPCAVNNKPKISTGAGDNFNAAYCCASLAGLPIAEKLRFANAYAGAYIAKGSSPDCRALVAPTLNFWV
jgi:sugar/nucleoside kinase (ribokinase family)